MQKPSSSVSSENISPAIVGPSKDTKEVYVIGGLVLILAIAAMLEVALGHGSPGAPQTTLWFCVPAIAINCFGVTSQTIDRAAWDWAEVERNPFFCPDAQQVTLFESYLDDIRKLLLVLNRLVDAGNTVLVVEHHLDVIKTADHVIDLGPEGGHRGGQVRVRRIDDRHLRPVALARAQSMRHRTLIHPLCRIHKEMEAHHE